MTTMAVGEEGGGWPPPKRPKLPNPGKPPTQPPITTQAVGEEGGR
jgi:hypothetical protein